MALLLTGGGATLFLTCHGAAALEQQVLRGENALARALSGVRELSTETLQALVQYRQGGDDAAFGLVYAIVLGPDGKLLRGALNARRFAQLGPGYQQAMLQGRGRVLAQLASGTFRRQGAIRQVKVGRALVLGFEQRSPQQPAAALTRVGLLVLGGVLVLGLLMLALLWRWGRAGPHVSPPASVAVEAPGEGPLAPYLDRAVRQRLEAAGTPQEMTVDERAAAVLALRLDGLSAFNSGGASAMARLANEYLAPVVDSILRADGVVVTMDGRSLVAVWGLPQPVRDPERHAMKAAAAAQAAAEQEARRQHTVGGTALQLCGGLATGRAAGANMGSARRLAYVAVGGAVELARESCRRAAAGQILATETVVARLEGAVAASPVEPLQLQGQEQPVALYAVRPA